MSEYRKTAIGNLYFLTLSIVGWINIFDRDIYKEILVENLKYCQNKEGLELYAYVIMSNHLHFIASREGNSDIGELIGRFKSYTAKKILTEIKQNPIESRKDWLLYQFQFYAQNNNQYDQFHFWQYSNHPTELYNYEIMAQKVDYIHDNPVRAGIVTDAKYYKYSSACIDSPLKMLVL